MKIMRISGFIPFAVTAVFSALRVIALDAPGHLTTDFTALDGVTVAALVGSPQGIAPPRTGWPEAVTRLRLPRNVACGFPALRSSEVDLQRFAAIRSSPVTMAGGSSLCIEGRILPLRGSGSIRAKLYGSALYAMFSRQGLGFAIGPDYAIAQ